MHIINIKLFAFVLVSFAHFVHGLVITDPCCHVLDHRGAMFGPELPVKGDSIFSYIPDRQKVSSVEGQIKLTDRSNPTLCHPEWVKRANYDFQNSIALIPRGGCSFAEKVYFAQLLGANAAIIFQSHNSAESNPITGQNGNDDVIVMAEDSRYGPLVTIPSAFISYNSWIEIRSLLSGKDSLKEFDVSHLENLNKAGNNVEDTDFGKEKTEYEAFKQLEELIDLGLGTGSSNRGLRSVDYFMNDQSELPSAYFKLIESYEDEIGNLRNLMRDTDIKKVRIESDVKLSKSVNVYVYVVVNETGSLASIGPDALPMMWDSMVFLVKVFLIIWSVMGFAYVSNWIKLRYSRLKRQNIIKSLPCKQFKKLHVALTPILSETDSLEIEDTAVNRKKKYVTNGEGKYEQVDVIDDGLENDIEFSANTLSIKLATADNHDEIDNQETSNIQINKAGSSNKSVGSVGVLTALDSEVVNCIDCDNCVICLCEFEMEDYVTVLPCKHIYHKDCIEPWLSHKSSLCPMCKQSIFKNGESRSINEIHRAETEGAGQSEVDLDDDPNGEQRRGSIALSVGMFMVIVLSFTFMLYDDNQ